MVRKWNEIEVETEVGCHSGLWWSHFPWKWCTSRMGQNFLEQDRWDMRKHLEHRISSSHFNLGTWSAGVQIITNEIKLHGSEQRRELWPPSQCQRCSFMVHSSGGRGAKSSDSGNVERGILRADVPVKYWGMWLLMWIFLLGFWLFGSKWHWFQCVLISSYASFCHDYIRWFYLLQKKLREIAVEIKKTKLFKDSEAVKWAT